MASVAVVGLISLAALSAVSLNLDLTLDLIPPAIVIYPSQPALYGFNLDLDPVPVPVPVPDLNLHRRSGCLQSPPLLGFPMAFSSRLECQSYHGAWG